MVMLQFFHHGGGFVNAVINVVVNHADDFARLAVGEMMNVKFVMIHQDHPAPVGVARGARDSGHVNSCPGKNCAILEFEFQPIGGMNKQAKCEE